jgi:hypothetical protein
MGADAVEITKHFQELLSAPALTEKERNKIKKRWRISIRNLAMRDAVSNCLAEGKGARDER